MVTLENQYKAKLITQVNRMGGYGRRIEDQFGVGVLDMIIIFKNLPVIFAEGKRVQHRSFGPTARQFIEGISIMNAGQKYADALMIGWDDKDIMYVGPWARTLDINDCFKQRNGMNYAATLLKYMESR